ncbi:hypothetical protein HK097_005114 [Rhizophlyctis rosea]|uniref:Uncharacterized protein n=1 Tax=Rhizophlyctis rosea TaxID=64517 RepID=A0AAD5SFR3_9FUNG|nr:hypothetical protein HK097_005114 [Rhizophlyctis rosea]
MRVSQVLAATALAGGINALKIDWDTSLCLHPSQIQTNWFQDGIGAQGQKEGQVASLTSKNNFINYCLGKKATNGRQLDDGSCNPLPMGDLPSINNMVSSIIIYPAPGDVVRAYKNFTVTLRTANLAGASANNDKTNNFGSPQHLDENGYVVGHTHVTVQYMGPDLKPQRPLDTKKFAFFLALNTEFHKDGSAEVEVQGLKPGGYRVCTMATQAGHQPVVMPVADRGHVDDCTKFLVK